MILRIDDNKSIEDLQDKFEQCFPGLRIEFYDQSHDWFEATPPKHQIPAGRLICDIRKINSSGTLEIKSWFQAGKVEQDFKELYGLNVQIFRLKNNKWVQTTQSDNLTLAQLIDKSKDKKAGVFIIPKLPF